MVYRSGSDIDFVVDSTWYQNGSLYRVRYSERLNYQVPKQVTRRTLRFF